MNRILFHKLFKSPGPVVLPVIRLQDDAQLRTNVRVAIEEGAPGVFLLGREFEPDRLETALRRVRRAHPALWLGAGFAGASVTLAYPLLGRLEREEVPVDGCWLEDAGIRPSEGEEQKEAEVFLQERAESGWQGITFGGVAGSRRQPLEPGNYEAAARLAAARMEVVTTAGPAVARETDLVKVTAFRSGCGRRPLAITSGVTPENAGSYAPLVDAFLISNGITPVEDPYSIDRASLRRLLALVRERGARGL